MTQTPSPASKEEGKEGNMTRSERWAPSLLAG